MESAVFSRDAREQVSCQRRTAEFDAFRALPGGGCTAKSRNLRQIDNIISTYLFMRPGALKSHCKSMTKEVACGLLPRARKRARPLILNSFKGD
jgi:hypothetical protein